MKPWVRYLLGKQSVVRRLSVLLQAGQLIGLAIVLCGLAIYTAAAGRNLVALIFASILFDMGQPMQQISNASRIAGIEPIARGRLNSVFVICIFIGQLWGTRASTSIFLGQGYSVTGAFWMACVCLGISVLFLRGPNEERKAIMGWKCGANLRKNKTAEPLEEKQGEARVEEDPVTKA